MTARLTLLLLLLLASSLGAAPAAASCALPPRESPDAFTGTVVSTSKEGRWAEVALPDGSVVEVRGGPRDGFTSVDRTFARGARYEFHPLSSSPPFEDNACTATRRVGGVEARGGASGGGLGDVPLWSSVVSALVGFAAVATLVVRRARESRALASGEAEQRDSP